MADISLNAGIRANLLSLQSTSQLFNRTTERLGTGKKVNSAVDNPTNYFASVNLQDRASGLNARLDSMGEAVQQIKAADNGITTMRSYVSSMKGIVNNALSNTDADSRNALGRQFNELIVQISEAAKDSTYAGINLLERNETRTVQFNETFDASILNVKGFNVAGPGADGRGRVEADGGVASSALTGAVDQASAASVASVASAASAASQASAGTNPSVASQAAQASVASEASVASGTVSAAFAIAIENQDDDTVQGIYGAGSGAGSIDWGADTYKADLAGVVQQLEAFDSALKTQSGSLANNLAVITLREDFTNQLVNTLQEGADKLVLADLNEEGANLLALQTASSLATQSLSLGSQQSQQVLQLLG